MPVKPITLPLASDVNICILSIVTVSMLTFWFWLKAPAFFSTTVELKVDFFLWFCMFWKYWWWHDVTVYVSVLFILQYFLTTSRKKTVSLNTLASIKPEGADLQDMCSYDTNLSLSPITFHPTLHILIPGLSSHRVQTARERPRGSLSLSRNSAR